MSDSLPSYSGEAWFQLSDDQPGYSNNIGMGPLSVAALQAAAETLKAEARGEGERLSVRPIEYPPVSSNMAEAMRLHGWEDRHVAEFFAGFRELTHPETGARWVYAPGRALAVSMGAPLKAADDD